MMKSKVIIKKKKMKKKKKKKKKKKWKKIKKIAFNIYLNIIINKIMN